MTSKKRLLFFTLLPLCLLLQSSSSLAAPVIGHLAFVTGEVELNGKPARSGDEFSVGQTVETHDGKVAVLLGMDTVIHLGNDSKYSVSAYKSQKGLTILAESELPYGQIRALVKATTKVTRRMSVRSRAATIGVRGTQFLVDSPQDAAKPQSVTTIEGSATLQSGAAPQIALGANQSASLSGQADAGAAPVVAEVSAETAAQMAAEIAPPAEEAVSADDMADAENSDKAAEEESSDMSDQEPPPFDPLSIDNGANIHLNLKIRKQTP